MSDTITASRSLIEPIYSQTDPSQPIDLGQAEVLFDFNGTTYQKTADVRMKFMPDDQLEFLCSLDGVPPKAIFESLNHVGQEQKLTLIERNLTIDMNCLAVGGDYDGMLFSPTRSPVAVTPPSNCISSVTFHLFNFPDFRGPDNYTLTTGSPPYQGGRTCGRVVLKANGWEITVAATDQTDVLTKALKRQGGYVITHMGRVVREDNATFSSKQIEDLLSCLQYFLSFALGRWVGVALPVGFDVDGNRVYEQWGMGRTADGPWNGGLSWFDVHHGELLPQVFPGFVSLWTNPLWHRPLTHAIYWYAGACDRRVGIGTDAGLILAQAALESLAWTYCVIDRKMVSKSAFKRGGLAASDKLRLLASSLSTDIPRDIPTSLSALHQKPGGGRWADAMDAITSIRNSLVHADSKTQFPTESYFEACKLALWYIEMALLRLCGHTAKYANRLAERRWAGTVEPVPWAHSEVDQQ
ncbi:MAG: hypothetical protein NTW96_24220 [Planctomycetia bacterium]|nr:hypothetical protein [Planctomycetia bacterium]